MKKIMLLLSLLTGNVYLYSQEMINGGGFESETPWTIIDVGSDYDPSAIIFNYTDDTPARGTDGCLSVSGAGITRNFIYQKVTLTKGHTYRLSCALKNLSDADNLNYWVEVNLVSKEPVLSGDGTASDFEASKGDYQMGMHYWKVVNSTDYSRVPSDFDGWMEETINFAWLRVLEGDVDSVITDPRNSSFAGDSLPIFTLPDTVSSTDWYLLIKAGAFTTLGATTPVYQWLFDNLSLWDLAEPRPSGITQFTSNSFELSPTLISNGIVTINSDSEALISYSIYNMSGMLVKSGKTGNNSSLDISQLKKGMYIIKLSNSISSQQFKIVLE
jgi:hypothetical protein